MSPVKDWVKELVEETMGESPLKIGQRIRHESGCEVEITAGSYWGACGLSNFWEWRKVLPDGSLGQTGCGYGYVNEKGILEGGKWLKK